MCEKTLPTADAVCTSCNNKLINSAPIFEHHKFFTPLYGFGGVCPVCNNHAHRFESILVPENAPWYKPQETKPCCPVCKTVLRRKYETKKAQRIYILSWLIFMFLQFTPKSDFKYLFTFIFCCTVMSYFAIIAYRRFRDPVKYVTDESALTHHSSGTPNGAP